MPNLNKMYATLADNTINKLSTCSVIFAAGETFDLSRIDPSMRHYTYIYETDAMQLAPGDAVVIQAAGKLSIGRVVEVHDKHRIEADAPYEYKFIVGMVGDGIDRVAEIQRYTERHSYDV